MDRAQFAVILAFAPFVTLAAIVFIAWWRQRSYVPGRTHGWAGWAILLTLGASFASFVYDQSEHGGNAYQSLNRALGLPAGMELEVPWLGDDVCARDVRRYRQEQKFPSREAMSQWRAGNADLRRLMGYLSDYYGVEETAFDVRAGTFDWQRIDDRYDLQDSGYWSPERFRYYRNELVCADIFPGRSGDKSYILAPCDPAARPERLGPLGRVAFVLDEKDGLYVADVDHMRASAFCTNPVRRRVNELLGLPHPD